MNIDVSFYDEVEEKAFASNYPAEYLKFTKAHKNFDFPVEDFKTYFLFRAQAKNPDDIFRSFSREIVKKWPYFEDYFTYNESNDSFNVTAPADGMTEMSESLGVAGALSVASKIFLDGTQADWRKIPVLKTKDFDFSHIASDGSKYFEVEAKGSIVQNNKLKTSALSNHKKNIKGKKVDRHFKDKYNYSNDCFFGVITCADPKNHLRALLVDPPAFAVEMDPYKYKLLARLYYYHDFTHHISSRSYVSILLANRIKLIEKANSINDFNSMPLTKSNFKKLEITESFVATRSFVDIDRDRYIGKCELEDIIINDKVEPRVVFIGVSLKVYDILIRQNFADLLKYKNKTATATVRLTCRLREDSASKSLLRSRQITPKEGYYSFFAETTLTVASSGFVWGLIRPEQISRVSMF